MNVKDIFEQRLTILGEELGGLEENIREIDEKVANLKLRLPKAKGKGGSLLHTSEEEINAELAKLELKLSTTAMDLNKEKAILREQEQLRAKVKDMYAYKAKDEEIKGLQAKRRSLDEAWKSKRDQVTEMRGGLKKLQLSEKVGVPVSDMVSIEVDVPEGRIGHVIGKKRASLLELETSCNVMCEERIDRSEGGQSVIVVTGSTHCCQAAKDKLERTTLAVEETFAVSEAVASVLKANRYALANELGARHNVRVDLAVPAEDDFTKPKGRGKAAKEQQQGLSLRMEGRPEDIMCLKAVLGDMNCVTEVVAVDEKVIPAVMGSKGSTLKSIEQEFNVVVDLDRKVGAFSVNGPKPAVAGAVERIKAVAAANADVEESIPLKLQCFVSMLLNNSGQALKEVRAEVGTGVAIGLQKSEGAGAGSIRVRGSAAKVQVALPLLRALLERLEGLIHVMHLPLGMAPVIVGKGGAAIKKLREAHPLVNFDVDLDESVVRLSGEDEPAMAAAQAALEQVVADNRSMEVVLGKKETIALLAGSNKALRESITGSSADGKGLGVNMDISKNDGGVVRLRGRQECMDAAAAILEEFRLANFSTEVSILSDDFVVLQTGLSSQLSEKCGVEMTLLRDRQLVRIKGKEESVKEAAALLEKALFGDGDGSSVMVVLDASAMGPVIGRGGANIKKMEKNWGVNVDSLSSRNQVRLRGEPSAVAKAKTLLLEYVGALKITAVVPMEENGQTPTPAALKALASELEIQVDWVEKAGSDGSGGAVKLRGGVDQVVEGKGRVREMLMGKGKSSEEVKLSRQQCAELIKCGDNCWRTVMDSNGVQVRIEEQSCSLFISGTKRSSVVQARKEVFSSLTLMFPGQFGSVAMPRAALGVVGSTPALGELTALTGATFIVDRPSACLRVLGEARQVQAAVEQLHTALEAWQSRNAAVPFQPCHLSAIIGKNGSHVKELAEQYDVTIDVDRAANVCRITSNASASSDAIKDAQKALEEVIERLTKEMTALDVPLAMVPRIIGKGGENIRKIQQDTGASLEFDKFDKGRLLIRGSPEHVEKAKTAMLEMIEPWVEQNQHESVDIGPEVVSAVYGPGGSVIRQLQEESGASLQVDKEAGVVSITGSAEAVAMAKGLVEAVVSKEKAAARQQQKKDSGAQAPVRIPGLSEAAIEAQQSLKKRRRRRGKKDAGAASASGGADAVEDLSPPPSSSLHINGGRDESAQLGGSAPSTKQPGAAAAATVDLPPAQPAAAAAAAATAAASPPAAESNPLMGLLLGGGKGTASQEAPSGKGYYTSSKSGLKVRL
ncbi:unnamed protein product [Chrysoparadoxa australica]